jgi:hypothetical protein
MIDLTKTLKCPHCGGENKIDLSDYVISEDSSERDMGEEVEYTIEGEFECSKCKCSCHISGSVWEYPVGAYNDDSLEVS